MEMSSNFMDSVDLQNGVFEEQGLKMLEEWEKKSSLMLLDSSTSSSSSSSSMLDLNQKGISKGDTPKISGSSSYDNLFNN
jgi:hypothetical protein